MELNGSPQPGETQIARLLQQLQQGKLSRRGFIRSAALLGLSVSAAQVLAACTQQPGPTAVPTPTYSAPVPLATATLEKSPMEMEMGEHPVAPVLKEIATYVPPPTAAPVIPTSTPVMWEAAQWACPSCPERFQSQEELVKHVLSTHVKKVPGVRRVDKPTYAQFLNDEIGRFDQRNIVFSRMIWDKEYIALANNQP